MPAYAVFLQDLQQPVTQAMLTDAAGIQVLRQTLDRTNPATGTIEIFNPGLSLFQSSPFIALLETPTGRIEDAVFLGRGRVGQRPSMKGSKATIPLSFSAASHKALLRNAAQALTQGAAIPMWTTKIVPAPGVGSIAVAFSGSAGASWDAIKARAFTASGVSQQDLVRTPYAKIAWRVLTIANARLVITVPASAAAAAYVAAQNQQYAHVAVSGDKNPQHGVYFTTGKVMTASAGPGGTVDIQVNLADPSLVPSGVAQAPGDPTAYGLPYFDALFGGDPNQPATAAISGRRAFWFTDPVTHAISAEDTLVGRRVVDLGGGGDESSFELDMEETPAKRIRLRIIATWTQRAVGGVDLAPVISTAAIVASGSEVITSMAPKVVEPTADPKLEFRTWGGFSRGKTSAKATLGTSSTFSTGRTVRVTYRDDTLYPGRTDPTTGVFKGPYTVQGTPFDVLHAEYASVNLYKWKYNAFWVSFDYSQQRQEVVDLVLDVDVQDTLLGTEEVDMGSITLTDLLNVTGVLPIQPGTIYNKGDRVLVGGKVYEAQVDGLATFWIATVKRISSGSFRTTLDPVGWADLGTLAPLPDWRSPTFFDTERGRGAISHGLMRMRRVAFDRLAPITVSKVYPWAVARTLTLQDEVTMTIRDGGGRKVIRGKISKLERMLGGAEGAKVKVTIRPSLGTGRNDAAPVHARNVYAASYSLPTYTAQNTSSYLAPSVVSSGDGVYSTGPDVEWALNSDPLVVPVDCYRLLDPFYACKECYVRNPAPLQLAEFSRRMQAHRDPRSVPQDLPTSLDIAMIPMWTVGVLQRFHRVHGQLTVSPQGMLLAKPPAALAA